MDIFFVFRFECKEKLAVDTRTRSIRYPVQFSSASAVRVNEAYRVVSAAKTPHLRDINYTRSEKCLNFSAVISKRYSLNSTKAVSLRGSSRMSAYRATSPFNLPRAYLIGRPAVCCGVVLPVCPCVVSFSKFYEPTHKTF